MSFQLEKPEVDFPEGQPPADLEIVDIWQKSDKIGVFVTHQIDEAVFIADQVVVLSPGPESGVVRHFDIPLPRPRTPDIRRSAEFQALVDEVWATVREEIMDEFVQMRMNPGD